MLKYVRELVLTRLWSASRVVTACQNRTSFFEEKGMVDRDLPKKLFQLDLKAVA